MANTHIPTRRLPGLVDKLQGRLDAISIRRAVWIVLLSGIALRVLLWFVYAPVTYSDTNSYRRLAGQILESWARYDGTRVPGYPVLLALAGSDGSVYQIQLVLGLMITLGFLYLGWRVTGKPWFGLLAGMAHQLNLGQLLFEANLLTETLATFFMVAALVGAFHGTTSSGAKKSWLALIIGLSAGLAVLTRPLFVVLPPWLFLWVWLTWRDSPLEESYQANTFRRMVRMLRENWLHLIVLVVSVAALVLGWMNFIHAQYGDWALSTMTGYHLVQHTGAFMEFAPDEYAAIRDTFLRYRDERVAQFGTPANTIWYAIPEMMRASRLNFYDLSRTLARLSLQLIWEHPGKFLRSVVEGWWLFWRAPVYWSAEALRLPAWGGILKWLVLAQRIVLVGVNIFFIFTPLLLWVQRKTGLAWPGLRLLSREGWIGLLGLVWFTSLVQALLDHGDNPRFLIPMQTILVMWFMWWIWSFGFPWWRALRVKSD